MAKKAEKSKKKEVQAWEVELEKIVHELAKGQKPHRLPVIVDIFKAAAKLAQESPGTLNLKITATTIKELRFSFKTFYAHRKRSKITMFGSARVPADTPLYAFAKDFAKEAAKRKYMVITGGGPGIMAAGNEGAEEKGGFGLNIRLPFEQEHNPFIDSESMLIHYKYFFTRKLFLVKEANAFAFFPGGFGTFDEAFEVLTLLQTGKSNLIPVVLVEPKGFGFWTGFTKFMYGDVLTRGFISEADKNLYRIFHSSKEALDHIDHFYSTYHSMRFTREFAVVRLKKTLKPAFLKKLNEKFGFLVKGKGEMKMSKALPEEGNEPELAELPRLIFPFDRRDYGNLRAFIDFINDGAV
ncbi:TIGR00730 family Rossman fold protein [bacterium]|nr:TIGR00730 family Rossman fold protein [bacterium]